MNVNFRERPKAPVSQTGVLLIKVSLKTIFINIIKIKSKK